MNEIKYKVIEDNEIPELAKIEKSGMVLNIQLGDSLSAYEQNAKYMKNIESELKIKKAILSNVEEHYPEVKDIDEKTKIACHTHYEATRFVAMAEEKLREFEEAQKELEAEIAEIEKQTGLKKTPIEENLKQRAEIMKEEVKE